MLEDLYKEALTRLAEIHAILSSDQLSEKGKLIAVKDTMRSHVLADNCYERGEKSHNNFSGTSREFVSLGNDFRELGVKMKATIRVDLFNS